jgi:hypothetical protein
MSVSEKSQANIVSTGEMFYLGLALPAGGYGHLANTCLINGLQAVRERKKSITGQEELFWRKGPLLGAGKG